MEDPVTHLEAIYAFIIKNNATELNCPTSVFALCANREPELEHRWEDQIRATISQIFGQPLDGDQSLATSQPRKPPTGKHKAKKVHFESHTETNNHIRYFCKLEDGTKMYANPKDVVCLCRKKQISKLSKTGFRATIAGNEWWRVFKRNSGKAGRWPKSEIIKTTKVFPPPTSSPDQDSTATISVVWPEAPASSSEATGEGPILAFDVSGYGIISALVLELQACMRTSDPFWLHVEQPSDPGHQKWWQDNFYSVINIIFKTTHLSRFGQRLWHRYKKQCHKYLPENIEKFKDMLWFIKALDISSKSLSGSQETTAQKMQKIMASFENLRDEVGLTDEVVDPFVALIHQLGVMNMMAEHITRDLLDILESEPESESCPNSDMESSYGPISPSPLTILRPKIPALLSAISHLRGWIESSEKACRENGRVLNEQKSEIFKDIVTFMKQFMWHCFGFGYKLRVSPDAGDCKQSEEQGRGKGQPPCEQPQEQSSAGQSTEQSTNQSTERLQEPNPKETDSPSPPKEDTAPAVSKGQFPIPDSIRPLFSQVIKKLEQMDELNEQVGRQFIQNFKTLRAIQKTIGNTVRFGESEEGTPANSGCSSRSISPLRGESLQQNISPSGTAAASTVASTIDGTLKICDTAFTRPMEVAESSMVSSSTSSATSQRATLRQSETCSSDSDDEKESVSGKGKKEKSKKKEKKEKGKEKEGGKACDCKKRKKSSGTSGTSSPKTAAATTKKIKKSNPKELHGILKKTEGNSYIWVDKTQIEKFRLEFEDARRVLLAAKEEKLESKKEEKVLGKEVQLWVK
ncbi:hypothetical protein QBC43DRAFT_334460 [Cladorrhinum sp. PSN259]|nr:hypothetical protein QBC43DRAFT_334460 [Cladorrhinum sp. PSN259]